MPTDTFGARKTAGRKASDGHPQEMHYTFMSTKHSRSHMASLSGSGPVSTSGLVTLEPQPFPVLPGQRQQDTDRALPSLSCWPCLVPAPRCSGHPPPPPHAVSATTAVL